MGDNGRLTRKYKYLYDINSPADLRKLPASALEGVCDEVREYMIDTITQTGGHFGAGLGIVELTVALHYIYNTPADKLVFDVGHQGYPHKILTGRRDLLPTIRQKGGLSGFLKKSESEYDPFGAGHASTSISAALGMAAARDMLGQDHRIIAIIGDGSMTGGLAFEGMNNCGVQKRDITVILNDNDYSIAPNVSAFSNYFNELFASSTVQKIRDNIWELTGRMDELGDRLRVLASRFEDGMKAVITPGVLFEALGFKYFGPINGHNISKLVRMLDRVKDIRGPVFLHVTTQKGKGYAPAEKDIQHLHAIGKIDRTTGKSLKAASAGVAYQDIFGEAMVEICRRDDKVVGITAAMPDGTGLDILQKQLPDRVIDVGIAEGHAVTFAAGMANEGVLPVVAVYSTFLQRAYDNIVHDCALQDEHVVFAIDRAGLVGEDGPTHHGVNDFAFLRHIPKMTVMAPKDGAELRDMLYSSLYKYKGGPVAMRYPRGSGPEFELREMREIPLGKSETLRYGDDIAILAIGKMVREAELAAEILAQSGISAEVVNARFVKPLDTDMIDDLCARFNKIITIEDHQIQGGFGSAVAEYMAEARIHGTDLVAHGIPDKFVEHGAQKLLLHDLRLDAEGIADFVRSELYGENILRSEYLSGKK